MKDQEREKLLRLYQDLRVCDVRDAMDALGHFHLQFEAKNIPIALGGVQIRPDYMVVADGDGVIAVPQEIASTVSRWAYEEHERDKIACREHYRRAGLVFDDTV